MKRAVADKLANAKKAIQWQPRSIEMTNAAQAASPRHTLKASLSSPDVLLSPQGSADADGNGFVKADAEDGASIAKSQRRNAVKACLVSTEALLKDVRGHIVEFPLKFLSEEKLLSETTIEKLLLSEEFFM